MQRNVHKQAEKYLRRRKKWKKWQKVVMSMACVVVFCTVYALILPAITANSKTSCGYEEHIHTDKCKEKKLICEISEEPSVHKHSDTCTEYKTELSCGKEETTGHTHNDGCYDEEQLQVCGLEESEGHTHTDECYTETTSYVCGMEEGQETGKHEHTDKCYKLVDKCDKEEHEHKLACFSDPDADVETREIWERTFEDIELTGDWSEDLIAIAESQLGYEESTENYVVENDKKRGYTRYGEWYGNEHGHWCAMYVSFCLNYAEVEGIPFEAGCQNWINTLSKEPYELYREAKDYTPVRGDLVFFNWDKEPDSDHVGIVVEYIEATEEEPAQIKTIEGNASNTVKYKTYDIDDNSIMGYAILPEEPEENESEELIELVQQNDLFTATATFEKGVLPEDAELNVKLLDEEEQEEALENFVQEEGKSLLTSQHMGIEFQKKSGKAVEPEGDVKFKIQFNEPVKAVEVQETEDEEDVAENTVTSWMLYRIAESSEVTAVNDEEVSLTEIGDDAALQTAAFAYEPAAAYAVATVAENEGEVGSFEDLQTAISNANTTGVTELKLIDNFDATSTITISGKNIVLDLAGHTITAKSGRVFTLTNNSSLTIKDSEFETEKIMIDNVSNADVCGNLAEYEKDTLTYFVTVPTISNKDTGATIETLQKYTVPIKGKIIAGGTQAIHIEGNSTFTLESGAVVGGTNRAINQESGVLNLAGGYICGNSSNEDGGAVRAAGKNTKVNLTGTVLAANSTKDRGGAINIYEAELEISGTAVISGNISTWSEESKEGGRHYGGGGINCGGDGAIITISGGYITNNVSKAKGYFDGGGGILLSNNSTLEMTGGYITGNKANSGGGIRTNWQNGVFVSMIGGYVCSNHAYSGEGGGISINMGASAQLLAGYVNNNSIGQSNHWGGGGVFCSNGSKLYMLNALITGNHAEGFGGGVAGCSTGRVYIAVKNGGAIYDNKADGSGEHLSGDTSTKNEDHALAFKNTVFMENGYKDYFCALASTVDGKMLGGNPANWKGSVDGRPVSTKADETLIASSIMGLTAHPTDIGKDAAQKAAHLFINGNSSYTHGGGVLANGYLIIGEVGNIEVSARIELSGTKAYQDATGAVQPMTGGEFEFVLTDAKTGTVVTTATNDTDGNIVFKDRLPFSEEGLYQYLLTESDPKDTTVTKDTSIYRITVEIGSQTTKEWGVGPGLKDGILVEKEFSMTQYLIKNVLIEKKNGENDTEWEEIYNQDPGDSEASAIQIPITSNETFTNYTFDPIIISVIKNWIGGNSDYDAVEVVLYQNDKEYDTVELNASNGWSYTWGEDTDNPLPQMTEDGKPCVYTVKEKEVEGYLTSYERIINVDSAYYWVPASTLQANKKYIIAYLDEKNANAGSILVLPNKDAVLTSADKEMISVPTQKLKIGNVEYDTYFKDEDIDARSILTARSGGTKDVANTKGRLKLYNDITSLALLIEDKTSGDLKTSNGYKDGYVSLFETDVTKGLVGHYGWDMKENESGIFTDYYRVYYTSEKFDAKAISGFTSGSNSTDNVKVFTRVAGPVKRTETIYVITNKKTDSITYGLDVTKVSSDNEKVTLKGAEFVLKDANGNILNFIPVKTAGAYTYSVQASNETTTKLVTDSLGKLVLTELPAGKYTLEETKAPTGYKVAAPQEVVLGEDITNPTLKIKVVDYREDEFIIPETGGIGTNMFTIGGMLLMMSSLLIGFTVRRKRERGYR